MSLTAAKNDTSGRRRSVSIVVAAAPNRTTAKITASRSPLAAAATGFVGTIATTVCQNVGIAATEAPVPGPAAATGPASESRTAGSTPVPTRATRATATPMTAANAVAP